MGKVHILYGTGPACGSDSLIAQESFNDVCQGCMKVLEDNEARLMKEKARLEKLLEKNPRAMSVGVQLDGIVELLTWVLDGAKGKPPTKRWFR